MLLRINEEELITIEDLSNIRIVNVSPDDSVGKYSMFFYFNHSTNTSYRSYIFDDKEHLIKWFYTELAYLNAMMTGVLDPNDYESTITEKSEDEVN